MKPTTAFALVASILPFAVAMPYNVPELAERDAGVDVAWVTDVEVATVVEQVTLTYTGEPAAVETVVSFPPVTTSSPAPVQTSIQAHNRQHDGNGRGRRSTVQFTIEKTTTPAPVPTSTSTVAPPPPPPPAAPTTLTTVVAPAPSPSTTSVQQAAITIPSLPVTSASQYNYQDPSIQPSWSDNAWHPYAPIPTNLAPGPSDYYSNPTDVASYIRTGDASWSGDGFKTAIIARHNAWRAKWGVGPLIWNDTDAVGAQSHAEGCKMEHDRNVGQNLAQGNAYQGPGDAVDAWGSESAQWQISNRDGSDRLFWDWNNDEKTYDLKNTTLGHFTQLVWRETTSVGCGTSYCNNNRLIVCNYFPWGNMGDSATAKWTDAEGRKGTYASQIPSVPVY